MRTLDELGVPPSPWRACDIGVLPVGVESAEHRTVCRVLNDLYCVENTARLIASAPMLYEALEECERKLDACDPYCNLLEKVRRALAAASGESEVAK